MKVKIFAEASFTEQMKTEVALWREENLKAIRYKSYDDTKIHAVYALNPNARGSVVFVHGFTEFIEKFLEPLYYFYEEGYSVFMYDQRGHGRSGRKIEDREKVYVGSFDEYVEDLWYFIDHIVAEKEPDLPRFLFGHSMGGCISALFLERYPEVFKAAILTSPMLKVNFGNTPELAAAAMAAFSKIIGRETHPIPGASSFSANPDFENACCTSEVRYSWVLDLQKKHRAYQTVAATFGWIRAAIEATAEVEEGAANAAMPILLLQAGNDTLVDNSAQDKFAQMAPNVTLVRIPEAKHEIYRSSESTLETYYKTIFDFLAAQC